MSGDNYPTDSWILDLFEGWLDPCPLDPLFKEDGLECVWGLQVPFGKGVFVNPPYSDPLPWVEKAIQENKANNITIVMLLKHDSSTKWYRLLHEAGAHFLMFQGRLKHGTGRSAPFPSVLVVLPRSEIDG